MQTLTIEITYPNGNVATIDAAGDANPQLLASVLADVRQALTMEAVATGNPGFDQPVDPELVGHHVDGY